jgi:integrase
MSFDIEILYDNKLTLKKKKDNMVIIPETSGESYYDHRLLSYFYFDEYSKLLDLTDPLYKLVYLFLFETGARIQEARAARYKDVDIPTSKIKIKTSKQRGFKKSRIFTISDRLRAFILERQVENIFCKFDFIMAKKRCEKSISQQSIDSRLKADCKILGIERNKAHCHAWRHTRAIQLQRFLGHSSIQSTLVYLKYSNHYFDQAIKEGNQVRRLI